MKPITALMSQYAAVIKEGEDLVFEYCKGGKFSNLEEYGLKVIGKTQQRNLIGKNLFDIENVLLVNKNIWDASYAPKIENGIIYSGGVLGETAGKLITLVNEGANTYTISFNKILGDTIYIQIYEFDEYTEDGFSGNNILYSNNFNTNFYSITFNVSKPYFGFGFYGNQQYDIGIENLQIELGSSATDYEEYCGGISAPNTNYPVPIKCVKQGTKIICGNEITVPCDLYEGDIWFPASGKVERHKQYVEFDGTENWTAYISVANHFQLVVGDNKFDSNSTEPFAKSNYYKGLPKYHTGEDVVNYGIFSADGYRLRFKNTDISTLEEWVDWVALKYTEGNPLYAVYELENSIIENYSPQTLHAIVGSAKIFQVPIDLKANLNATLLCRKQYPVSNNENLLITADNNIIVTNDDTVFVTTK